METKKGIGIMQRMLLVILPVVVIAMVLLGIVSNRLASDAINEQTGNYMDTKLAENTAIMEAMLDNIRNNAENLSVMVGSVYRTDDMDTLANIFTNVVKSDDMILGSGIWFEPIVYTGDPRYMGLTYVGPYWYRDGDKIVETWEYSNAEYDYFSQEYYLNAKAQTQRKAVITDPYYDAVSNSVMATCSVPIYNRRDQFVGCITVDMSLGTIDEMVGSIRVGQADYSFLTTADGTYIRTPRGAKTADGLKISEDSDAVSAIAGFLLGQERGTTSFRDGGKMLVYFDTLEEVGWKLAICIPEAEVNASVNQMTMLTVILFVVFIVIAALIIFFFARSIARPIGQVSEFAEELAEGNFTVEPLKIHRSDELGTMGASLNSMYEANSGIIRKIQGESDNINDASSTLGAMSQELAAEFTRIQTNVEAVNEAMMNSSAATEEVSASVTEVNVSVRKLAAETEELAREVDIITSRAKSVEEESAKARNSAISIAGEREKELREAAAKAAIVSQIQSLANAISDIASEIDLLSLNASIEAARAGDAGRGFAVVAQQINKLATATAEAVDQIQGTVSSIQGAFRDLAEGSEKLLTFVTDTVTPDYEKFHGIGKQYGEDAELFGQFSGQILEMTTAIRTTMDQVSSAVQNIAEGVQETAAHSTDVTDAVGSISGAVDSVADLATRQQATASDLADIVRNFKLS